MKRSKKIIAAALSVLGFASLGFAVACNQEPTYYKLTYESDTEGATFDFGDIKSGAGVKDGYTVEFTYSQADNVLGEAKIMLNDEEIKPNSEGVYSFVMKGDSYVTVTGVSKINSYTVTFDTDNNDFITFNADGAVDGELTVDAGETVEFTLGVSVYYGENPEYDVLADTRVLKANSNGVYSLVVTQDTTITVSGLELDNLDASFLERANCGSGTKNDPYLISRPIDLYVMADVINDDWYLGTYGKCYYKLVADIDMQGERLYVIGDNTTDYAYFCGDFNGNGHKIYNYTMKDTLIEQDSYTTQFITHIGLFGNASASSTRSAEIYDLTLEDFTITISSAREFSSMFFAGGLVGLGVGANIYGCNVNGTIVANADTSYFCYIGGIAGSIQSAYQSSSLNYTASIANCNSSVTIRGASGLVYAAGGITGYLYGAQQKTPAYIVNCTASGNVSGAMSAGGIVGRVNSYTSVKNCYSNAKRIYANNSYTGTEEEYFYAYAGGIAGYAQSDSIISNCYSTSAVVAYSGKSGSQYRVTGDVVAYLGAADSTNILSSAAISFNNYSANDSITFNKDFAMNTLGWSESDWSFDGDNFTVKYSSLTPSVVLNLKDLDSSSAYSNRVALDAYSSIVEWYNAQGVDFNEYTTYNNNRSYGYFLDSEGKVKIPYSYVITGTETIYVGFVDYSEVAGIYYINEEGTNGSNIHFVLSLDGTLSYVDGAQIYTTEYYYDGNKIYLLETPVFTETTTTTDTTTTTSTYNTTATATVSDKGILTAVNGISYVGSTAVTAIKKLTVNGTDFVYGNYEGSDGTVYVFNTDGTGTKSKGTSTESFTYTVSGSDITLSNSESGIIASGKVTSLGSVTLQAYDAFAGVWEKSATSHKEFNFDGLGNWTYEYYGYKTDGTKVAISNTLEGTYVYNDADDKIELSLNGAVVGEAAFNGDGFLKVTLNGATETYYQKSSYVGEWRFAYKGDTITLTIGGIGADGFGTATLNYESLSNDVNVMYDVRKVTSGETTVDRLCFFLGADLLGYLTFDATNSTLTGSFYSYDAGENVNAVFCLKDDFNGKWISSPFESIQFNGYGLYNISGSSASNTLPVSGTVTIGKSRVTYTIDPATNKGTFTYKGTTYTIIYNEEQDIVEVTSDDAQMASFELHKFDKWYGYTFIDEDGATYVFNGGGTLTDGGKVTVTNTDKTTVTYNYKVEGDKTNVYNTSGTLLGEIVTSSNKYVFVDKHLTIDTRFTGEWIVGGNVSGDNRNLVINEIGVDGSASGSYLGNAVTFTYNSTANSLTFTYGNTTYYLRTVGSTGVIELTLTVLNSTTSGYVTCVKETTLDSFGGTYTAADGGYVYLDGLGESTYGSGTAVQYNKDGNLVATYSYSINKFGMVELLTTTYSTRIFKEVTASTDGAYVNGSKAYTIVTPDFLYLESATDVDDGTITYSFDGVGGVTASNGKSYSYAISAQSDNDSVDNVYRLVFVSDGVTYDAVLDYGTSDYMLTVTARKA